METLTKSKLLNTDLSGLQRLIESLQCAGWKCIGPKIVNGVVQWGTLNNITDLPRGWTDIQSPARYELRSSGDERIFGVVHGAESAKNHLFPPTSVLWRAKRIGGHIQIVATEDAPPRVALIGLRPCDLAAIHVQDRVFIDQDHQDAEYVQRRKNTLLVVVNCIRSHETCFCSSVGGGTIARDGYDISITEILEPAHRFLIRAGSERGKELLDKMDWPEAEFELEQEADRQCERAMPTPANGIETDGLKELLYRNAENPQWAAVAGRCYACGSCTQVCPTCFCHTPHDTSDLDGTEFERTRAWDSCFSEEYSYIHGGAVRLSTASRYRQWVTHKLASWQDQFDVLGCVGCGRCITWCPAAIDIRQEVDLLRATELANPTEQESRHVRNDQESSIHHRP